MMVCSISWHSRSHFSIRFLHQVVFCVIIVILSIQMYFTFPIDIREKWQTSRYIFQPIVRDIKNIGSKKLWSQTSVKQMQEKVDSLCWRLFGLLRVLVWVVRLVMVHDAWKQTCNVELSSEFWCAISLRRVCYQSKNWHHVCQTLVTRAQQVSYQVDLLCRTHET